MIIGLLPVDKQFATVATFVITALFAFHFTGLASATENNTDNNTSPEVHYMDDQERDDWLLELNQKALQIVPKGGAIKKQDPQTVLEMKKNAGIGLDMTSVEGCQTIIQGTLENTPIVFYPGQTKIRPEGKHIIDMIVNLLNGCAQANIIVEGHSDSAGNPVTNQRLSGKRADAIAKLLESKGIDKGRLRSIGYGDSKPIAPNDTKENKAKNRRIELTLY